MPTNRCIQISFQKEGIHCYPAAKTNPELADVSFLGDPHRHIFHFYVTIQVYHDDREIEFILFKRWIQSLFSDGVLDINYKSCEMLADELVEKIKSFYPGRYVAASVFEDDENGAIIEYVPD